MTDKPKCPHCGCVLDHIQKMSGSWFECKNMKCPWLETQPKPEPKFIRGINFTRDYPLPYSTGFKSY